MSGVVTVTVQACVHAKTEDVAEIPATCTEPGVTAGVKCTVCGAVVSGCETIPALGHDFDEWTVGKAATCTESGTESRTCARCQETETRTVDALGHDFKDGKCAVCGAADPDYKPGEPVEPGVKTEDGSYVMLWSAVLLTSAAAVVLLPRKKRS